MNGSAAVCYNIPGRLERLPMTNYQRRIFFVIASAWLVDQIDVALLTFLLGSLIVEFGLSPEQAGLLAAMTFLGQLVGNLIAGTASDMFGRKLVFQVTMIVWGAASLLAAISWSVSALMFFRFLIGTGIGGEAPVAQAMVSEFVPANVRGKYIAFMEGFWAVGYVLSGAISFFLLPYFSWRWVIAAVGLLSAVVFLVRRNIPESPRWLADKGRGEEADAILLIMEAEVQKRIGRVLPAATQLTVPTHKQNPWTTLFSAGYVGRTAMASGLWFFALLGFFGLNSWIAVLLKEHGFSIVKSVGFVTLITTGGIPGFALSAYALESIGRKPTTVAFLILCAVTAYIYGTASDEAVFAFSGFVVSKLFIAGWIMQFFMFGMWSCLYAYTPELYPTRARSTGAGFASSVGRVGAIISPIVIGYIVKDVGVYGVFALGAGSFFIAAVLVFLFGVETRGEVLERVSG
jgi:putative MFS transporter